MVGKLLAILILTALMYTMVMNGNNNLLTSQNVDSFKNWMTKHGVDYETQEIFQYRFQIFSENLLKIKEHNQQNKSWWMSVNQFSALTSEEFVSTYLGLKNANQGQNIITKDSNLVGDVDWRQKGAVSAVKNQGNCGADWAFATTGNLEGVSAIFGGSLQSFSEQQLLDCSNKYGNEGCNGGWMDYGFQYVIDNGINPDSKYPYQGSQGTCKMAEGPFKVKTFTDVQPGDCDSLVNALAIEPISVGVDGANMQSYGGGVFNNCSDNLNLGLTLIGSFSNYYIFGKAWGEQGYIRIAKGNTCGICNAASYSSM